jgi:PAS domain S-box-containing protein
LKRLFNSLFPRYIKWKSVLIESLVFTGIYITWVIFHPDVASSTWLVGSLSILTPGATAAYVVFRLIKNMPARYQKAWLFLGWSLVSWTLAMGVRTFYELEGAKNAAMFWTAIGFNFLVFPLFFCALLFYPVATRYAPSRFRFLLDAIITSGVVAVLCWWFLARPTSPMTLEEIGLLLVPIADLIILMILINMLLANPKARPILILWGLGLATFLLSDYIYGLLIPVEGYQPGSFESIGWMIGGLVFVVGTAYFAGSQENQEKVPRPNFDMGTRIQNILPITFVLVLCWITLMEWRLTGKISSFGLTASSILVILLIARLGVQAGEEELHKYWQLFDSVADPTFLCNARGELILGNPAMVRILGSVDEEPVAGRLLTEIFESEALIKDLLTKANKQSCSLEVSHSASKTPFLLSLSPIISERRKPILAGVAQDLSDQKKQQKILQESFQEVQAVSQRLEELNSVLEEKVAERTQTLEDAFRKLEEQHQLLQELDQLKSDFVSMVSHELRTPLTSLNGGFELLLSQKNRKPADTATLSLMRKEIQRLTLFVESILNLSAIEAGRIKIHPTSIIVFNEVEEICSHFNQVPGSERLRINIPTDIPQVKADKVLLDSVLRHLIDNSLKYTPGGPVIVDAIPTGKKVRIQVTDSGPGIPDEKLTLLFKRFQRLEVKDSQSVYGHGLGLYLSRKMLQAMQSDLKYETAPQGGARFFFSLKVSQ